MPAAIDTEVTIDHPVDVVWERMTDWGRTGDWMPGVDSVEADGETATGTTLTFRARGKDRTATVLDVEPGRALTLRSVQGGVTADYRYQLEPAGESRSRAQLVAECRTSGLWSLIGPLLRLAIRRTDGSQMLKLKAALDSGSP